MNSYFDVPAVIGSRSIAQVPPRPGKSIRFAIQVLKDVYHIDASEARRKSWEEFGDLQFDFVITVCDNTRESCPIWPGGQPIVAH